MAAPASSAQDAVPEWEGAGASVRPRNNAELVHTHGMSLPVEQRPALLNIAVTRGDYGTRIRPTPPPAICYIRTCIAPRLSH